MVLAVAVALRVGVGQQLGTSWISISVILFFCLWFGT
jgi:hypothetical protein